MSATIKESVGDVLRDAESLFAELDAIMAAKFDAETRIRKLCLRYGEASGQWGTRPEHVRNAMRMRAMA